MDVHVGSFSNPEGIEGLAHFLGSDPCRNSVVEICIRFVCLLVLALQPALYPGCCFNFPLHIPLEQEWYLERFLSY